MCVITGQMIADIIFIFMCLLAKLLDRSIAAKIEEWQIYGNAIKRFKIRYPVVFYFNILCAGILGIIYVIWNISKYDAWNKILVFWKLIITSSHIAYNRDEILSFIAIFGVVANIIFLALYLFAKIVDINIGWCINIKYTNMIYIQELENDKFSVYKTNWPYTTDILLKEFNNHKRAERYRNLKAWIEKNKTRIINLPKRLFFRYRVICALNISLCIAYIIIYICY